MLLFVDINDVFRAPMAALLYHQMSGQPAHSAGVYVKEGSALGDAVRPYELDGHSSRMLSASMLEKADAVWCMTAAIARHLREDHPQYAQKIHAMEDIPDPVGTGAQGYADCIPLIRAGVEAML